MPFRSSKQRRYLWARKPELAREWTQKYGATPVSVIKARKKRKKRVKHV